MSQTEKQATGKISFASEMARIKNKLGVTPKETAEAKGKAGKYGMASEMKKIHNRTKK